MVPVLALAATHVVIVRAEGQTKVATEPAEVLGRLDELGAPRLAERWEGDPCGPPPPVPSVPVPVTVTPPTPLPAPGMPPADELVLPDLGANEVVVDILARGAAFPIGTAIAERALPLAAHDNFRAYYASLFDLEGPIVIEHVGVVAPAAADLTALGADPAATDWVLTRIHVRSGAALAGAHLHAAAPSVIAARFTLAHPWLGPLACEHPVHGRFEPPVETPALDLPAAVRSPLALDAAPPVVPAGSDVATGPAARGASGCGCGTSDSGSLVVGLGGLAIAARRRRPRSRGARSKTKGST